MDPSSDTPRLAALQHNRRASTIVTGATPMYSARRDIEEERRQKAQEILSRPSAERTPEDVRFIADILKTNKFFRDQGGKVRMQVARMLELDTMDSDQVVFSKGDEGDAFFFILTGRVSVNVPHEQTDELITVTELKAGDSFGELALVRNDRRTATIITQEYCEFMKLDKDSFNRILKGDFLKQSAQKVEFLIERVPNLKSLSRLNLEKVAYYFRTKIYKKDAVIIQQGQPADHVFFIVSGECKMVYDSRGAQSTAAVSSSSSHLGFTSPTLSQLGLGLLNTGQCFGEETMLDQDATYPFSVIATSPTVETFGIRKQDIFSRLPSETIALMKADAEMKKDWRHNRIESVMAMSKAIKDITYQPKQKLEPKLFFPNASKSASQKLTVSVQRLKTLGNNNNNNGKMYSSTCPDSGCNGRPPVEHLQVSVSSKRNSILSSSHSPREPTSPRYLPVGSLVNQHQTFSNMRGEGILKKTASATHYLVPSRTAGLNSSRPATAAAYPLHLPSVSTGTLHGSLNGSKSFRAPTQRFSFHS
eukprot:GILK01008923.1.p1 GENE.GILK01008923.1~~GILK01008923.1.p1  ORF type:complete len:587 (+),score=107.11 GILK01008923.1:165-1763(+)